MQYKSDEREIRLGDHVLVDGVRGTVVCDFDKWKCLDGYEGWLSKEELVGGGALSTGIMIETKDLGFLHYPEADDGIVPDSSFQRSS